LANGFNPPPNGLTRSPNFSSNVPRPSFFGVVPPFTSEPLFNFERNNEYFQSRYGKRAYNDKNQLIGTINSSPSNPQIVNPPLPPPLTSSRSQFPNEITMFQGPNPELTAMDTLQQDQEGANQNLQEEEEGEGEGQPTKRKRSGPESGTLVVPQRKGGSYPTSGPYSQSRRQSYGNMSGSRNSKAEWANAPQQNKEYAKSRKPSVGYGGTRMNSGYNQTRRQSGLNSGYSPNVYNNYNNRQSDNNSVWNTKYQSALNGQYDQMHFAPPRNQQYDQMHFAPPRNQQYDQMNYYSPSRNQQYSQMNHYAPSRNGW